MMGREGGVGNEGANLDRERSSSKPYTDLLTWPYLQPQRV